MPQSAKISIAVLVREQVDALDGFIAEAEPGVRNQRHVDELDAQLGAIIARLSDARKAGRYQVAGTS